MLWIPNALPAISNAQCNVNEAIMTKHALLQIKNLHVTLDSTQRQNLTVLKDINLELEGGELLGLVGESGCGKSMLASTIMGLLPHPWAKVTQGSILWQGLDLLQLSPAQRRHFRGRRLSMIFQDPTAALNPSRRLGSQLEESLQLCHPELHSSAIKKRGEELLELVGLGGERAIARAFPHEVSGGQRQRVVIAIALAGDPELLIADEATTALDVSTQAQIIDLLRNQAKAKRMSLIVISHNLPMLATICNRIAVMYAGSIVESGHLLDTLRNPLHPYTQDLLRCIPQRHAKPKTRLATITGQVPALHAMPRACAYANRCRYSLELCKLEAPPSRPKTSGQGSSACWRPEQWSGERILP